MAIPSNITSELAFLQTQVQNAMPLEDAPQATLKAIQLNCVNLVNDIQTALTVSPSTLDTWTAPLDAPSIVAGFLLVSQAAQDQSNLSLMRGVSGRALSNVNQLV